MDPVAAASSGLATSAFDATLWNAYRDANAAFADIVCREFREGDIVWVHDYHLLLLPAMLKKRLGKSTAIGFFLHTPWPPSEVFRMLPCREEILRGLLEPAGVIGFHDASYVRHFLSSVASTLRGAARVTSSSVALIDEGGCALPPSAIAIAPIGIEPAEFAATLRTDAFRTSFALLDELFSPGRVIVAVDRLDPIKGVSLRLHAFRQLLRRHPEWRGRVRLLQVAVPSRSDVPAYARLKVECETLVSAINAEHHDAESVALGLPPPVTWLHRSVDAGLLAAIYGEIGRAHV